MCVIWPLSGWQFLSSRDAFPLHTVTLPRSSNAMFAFSFYIRTPHILRDLTLGLLLSTTFLGFVKRHWCKASQLLRPPMFKIAVQSPVRSKSDTLLPSWHPFLDVSKLACPDLTSWLLPLLSELLYHHKLSFFQGMSPVYLAFDPTKSLMETESHPCLLSFVFSHVY